MDRISWAFQRTLLATGPSPVLGHAALMLTMHHKSVHPQQIVRITPTVGDVLVMNHCLL
jgi:hypothetical protein